MSKSTKNKLMRKLAHVKVLKAIKKQAGSVLYMPHGASIGALSSDKGSRLPGAVAGALAAPIGVSGGAALGGLLFDKGLAGRTGAGMAGGAMAAYLAARAYKIYKERKSVPEQADKQAASAVFMPGGALTGAMSAEKGDTIPAAALGSVAAPFGAIAGGAAGKALYNTPGKLGGMFAGAALAAYLAAKAYAISKKKIFEGNASKSAAEIRDFMLNTPGNFPLTPAKRQTLAAADAGKKVYAANQSKGSFRVPLSSAGKPVINQQNKLSILNRMAIAYNKQQGTHFPGGRRPVKSQPAYTNDTPSKRKSFMDAARKAGYDSTKPYGGIQFTPDQLKSIPPAQLKALSLRALVYNTSKARGLQGGPSSMKYAKVKQALSPLFMPGGAVTGALSADEGDRIPGAALGALVAPVGAAVGSAVGGTLYGGAGNVGGSLAGSGLSAYLAAKAYSKYKERAYNAVAGKLGGGEEADNVTQVDFNTPNEEPQDKAACIERASRTVKANRIKSAAGFKQMLNKVHDFVMPGRAVSLLAGQKKNVATALGKMGPGKSIAIQKVNPTTVSAGGLNTMSWENVPSAVRSRLLSKPGPVNVSRGAMNRMLMQQGGAYSNRGIHTGLAGAAGAGALGAGAYYVGKNNPKDKAASAKLEKFAVSYQSLLRSATKFLPSAVRNPAISTARRILPQAAGGAALGAATAGEDNRGVGALVGGLSGAALGKLNAGARIAVAKKLRGMAPGMPITRERFMLDPVLHPSRGRSLNAKTIVNPAIAATAAGLIGGGVGRVSGYLGSDKQAGVTSEVIGTGLTGALPFGLGHAANAVGTVAGALTKTRTPVEQAAASQSGAANFIPGYGAYQLTKRLGRSAKDYGVKKKVDDTTDKKAAAAPGMLSRALNVMRRKAAPSATKLTGDAALRAGEGTVAEGAKGLLSNSGAITGAAIGGGAGLLQAPGEGGSRINNAIMGGAGGALGGAIAGKYLKQPIGARAAGIRKRMPAGFTADPAYKQVSKNIAKTTAPGIKTKVVPQV